MKKIGKYEIVEELGRGGMGLVYRAYDSTLERDVALKVIQEIALDVADAKARFYREARMAARLSHDAIAVIYEIGEEGGLPFIAMEYIPGRDLRMVIDKKEGISLDQKLDYARQICRGLQYAHGKNVIHRDIKPENIKLLDDGRVKIIDFGIAKPYAPTASPEERSTAAALTRMGMRVGTPWYMSPEQARGNPVDRRTDIFSFGVVLYELLTYAKPFQGDDTTVLYKILHEEPPPIRLEESGLRDDLQKILSRCLAKDHEERYADCSEILRDLVALTGGTSSDPRIHALLAQGIALDKAERYEEAAAKFNQILEIEPENSQAKSFLKRLALRDRDSFMRRVLAGNVVGTVISHFQILDRIGGGGMGVVYRAEDMSLKRIVALKFLMPDLVQDPSAKKRFLKEAQAASALDHPNICTIHEISEFDEGLLFICMAYYGGENLSAKISRGPLTVGEALDIVIRIGRGLAKAHEHGIVHRDIKPANIIITPDGEAKIVDFGLAKLTGGTQITRVGARMGTLPYMSPEQIKGLDLDQRTDIWSLAVLLYQTLTGQLPFQREYEAAVLYAIVTDDPPLLTSVQPGLPADIERVISRALKKDPNERYALVQTMADELELIRSRVVQTKDLAVTKGAEADSLLREAQDLLKHGRYQESLARAEKVLRVAPADERARDLRDECVRKLREADVATVFIPEASPAAGGEKGPRAPAGHAAPQPVPARASRRKPLLIGASVLALVVLVTAVMLLLPKKEGTPPVAAERRTDSSSSAVGAEHAAVPQKPAEEKPAPGKNAALPSTDLGELTHQVSSAREEMLVEKKAALQLGAKAGSSTQFREGLNYEHEGDRASKAENREGQQDALSAYRHAGDAFKNVNDEAAHVAGLRKDAEAGSAAMTQAKLAVPGSDAEKKANAKYRSALDAESGARNLFQSQDYAGARDGFVRAGSLYADAAGEIRTAIAKEKPVPPPAEGNPAEKKEPARSEREEKEATLRQTLEAYKKSFEEGDTQTWIALRNLPPEASKNSEEFFRSTENRTMTIGQVTLQTDLQHARAELMEKYSVKDYGDAKTLSGVLTLEFVNSRWTITLSSIK